MTNDKRITVLVGGCFDLIHYGHIQFLKAAKKAGDYLMVALESDEKVKQLKGPNRPVHNQNQRAEMLASLSFVDKVIKLPLMKADADYFELVKKIKPDIIAVTAGDSQIENKKNQAMLTGAKIKIVSRAIKNLSTSRLAKIIAREV